MEERSRRIAIVFISTLLVQEAVKLTGLMSLIEAPAMKLVVSQTVLALPAFVYIVMTAVRCRENFVRVYVRETGDGRCDVLTIVLAIVMAVLMRPLLALVNLLSSFIARPVITDLMSGIAHDMAYLPALTVVALLPAFLEESIYRGVFFGTYRKMDERGAIIVSALMFGLLHGNLNQFIYAFVSGLIFCLAVIATDSIRTVMVMHFTTNAVSLAILYLQEAGGSAFFSRLLEIEGGLDIVVLIAVVAVSAALLAWLIVLLAKRNGQLPRLKAVFLGKNGGQGESPAGKQRIMNLPLVLGMLLCLLNIVINELAMRGIIT